MAEFELLPPEPKRLTKDEAQTLHDKILKSTTTFADEACAWLYHFDAGRGWEALGHASFKDYAMTMLEEAGVSSYYEMRAKGRVDFMLTQATGRAVHLQMRHALALKDLEPPQMVLAFNEAYGVRGVAPTAKMIERIAKKLLPAVKKSQRRKVVENNGWTQEELAKDKELSQAFSALQGVWGQSDVKALKNGTVQLKRAEIILMAKLPKERLMEMRDLILGHGWTPQQALKFLGTMPDKYTTAEDFQYYALSTKSKHFTADIDGFEHICRLKKAVPRL